jgi:hypothetical protein
VTDDAEQTTTPRDEARPKTGRRSPRASAGTDTPPRDAPRRRVGSDRKLRDALTNTYQTVGTVVAGIGHSHEDAPLTAFGVNVANHAEDAADAWMELADQNPGVKAALARFAEGSAVANLIGVHVSMAFPLLVARGLVPGFVAQTAPPAPDQNGAGGGNG